MSLFIKIVRQLAFYGAFILIWKFLFSLKIWPQYQFPSPEQVVAVLRDGLYDKSLLAAIFTSMQRLLLGYVVSVVLGIGLGLLIGKFKVLDETMGSFFVGLQTLPSICWLPIATLWFGIGEKSVIFVVIIGSILSVAIATDSGIKNIQFIYLKVGQTMGARGFTIFKEVIFPAAFPSILIGLKQGWIFAWRSLMAAEMLYVSLGLGHLLSVGRELNDSSQILAVMAVIVILGILMDNLIFGVAERKRNRMWGAIGRS